MSEVKEEVVRGYKVFKSDWTCKEKQYSCPGIFEEEVDLKVCKQGMHFCQEIADCFSYYRFNSENHVAEVVAYGDVVTEGDKSCTNKLEIVRELSWEEVLKLANNGEHNTGYGNSGDCNTGNQNVGNINVGNVNVGDGNVCHENVGGFNIGNINIGSFNIGDSNIGSFNIGSTNSGRKNTGHYNSGNENTGHYNIGDYNTGDFNCSDYNTGCFNTTEESTIMLFNQPSDWTYNDWLYSDACNILLQMPPLKRPLWVYSGRMTEEQKNEHPEHKTTKGCLVSSQGYSRQTWWNEDLSDEEKNCIKSLPNFDADIFLQCTGIKVD